MVMNTRTYDASSHQGHCRHEEKIVVDEASRDASMVLEFVVGGGQGIKVTAVGHGGLWRAWA